MTQAKKQITLIGAGLTDNLLAVFLARRGFQVTAYERNRDLLRHGILAGRSINLTLAYQKSPPRYIRATLFHGDIS